MLTLVFDIDKKRDVVKARHLSSSHSSYSLNESQTTNPTQTTEKRVAGEAVITILPTGFVRSLILRLFPGIKNAMNFYSDQYCFHDHYLSLLFTSSQSRGPKQHWCFDDCDWSSFVTKLQTKKDTE